MPMLPTPSRVAVEHVNTAGNGSSRLVRGNKGKGFVGVGDGNISTDNRCDLVVGNPSNKVKNGAWEVGIYAIPMVSAVKALIASYRFIKTNFLLIGFAGLISLPRIFVCLRNNDSSFLE